MNAPAKIGLAVFTLLLLAGSIAMMVNRPVATNVSLSTQNLLETPRHPVSNEMADDATARAGSTAPNAVLVADNGKSYELAEQWSNGPVVLVMTKDGCPCSIEAQPHFSELAKRYATKIKFFAVFDADQNAAAKYGADFSVPYPVLASPTTDYFKKLRAKQSVYTFLVATGGKIERVWPGYNKDMLRELNSELSRISGIPAKELEMTLVPDKMTSGCYFFMPVGTDKPAWND